MGQSIAYSEHVEWLVLVTVLAVVALGYVAWLIVGDLWQSRYRPGIDRTLRRGDDQFARAHPANSETPRIAPGGSTTRKKHTP